MLIAWSQIVSSIDYKGKKFNTIVDFYPRNLSACT